MRFLEMLELMTGGVQPMAIVLDKFAALKAACVARQAERSVAFGLRSSAEWARMVEYYHEERRQLVLDTMERLEALTSHPNRHVSRESVFRFGLLGAVERLVMCVLNCFRRQWAFSEPEIQFIAGVLHTFVGDMQKADKPEPRHLVELRMDLLTCHEIIGRRMAGIPEFEKALKVEHFCQSDYLQFLTIEEICGPSALVSA